MEDIVKDLVDHLIAVYSTLPQNKRYLVGLSGVPGSGKSTIAAEVVSRLNQLAKRESGEEIADGFHFYRAQLDRFPDPLEAHARRGAPYTFDAEKYVRFVKLLKEIPMVVIHAPSFDHSVKDPVEDDITINSAHRVVVIEGNYIHLTVPPWNQATCLLDEKWFIKVERDVARARVIRRHLISGIVNNEEEAAKRFDDNDWPNGLYLLENSDIENAERKINSIQDRSVSVS